jgi:hypothetical protein
VLSPCSCRRRRPSKCRRGERRERDDENDPAQRGAHAVIQELVDRAALVDRDDAAHRGLVDLRELQHHPEQTEVAREGDDEGGKVEPSHQRALHESDQTADRQAADDAQPPRQVHRIGDELRDDKRADSGGVADRQVDLGQDEYEHHRRPEHDVRGRLLEQVDQVAGGEELRLLDLEEDDDDHQPDEDREGPALAVADALAPGTEVLARAGGEHLWGGGRQLLLADRWIEIIVGPDRHRRRALAVGGDLCVV